MNGLGIVGTLVACLIAYLIGSFNWSLFIGHTFYKTDVRNYYSKNAGATNLSRVLGYKIAFLVVWLDMFKVPISMLLALAISFIGTSTSNLHETSLYIPAFFTIIGHMFPIYSKFKGGKGVSCFIGLLWMVNPYLLLIWTVVWWGLFFIFRYVSLSSIIGALFVIGLCWIPQLSGVTQINTDGVSLLTSNLVWFNHAHKLNTMVFADNLVFINTTVTASGLALIAKHHQNIKRLIKHTESKIVSKQKTTQKVAVPIQNK